MICCRLGRVLVWLGKTREERARPRKRERERERESERERDLEILRYLLKTHPDATSEAY